MSAHCQSAAGRTCLAALLSILSAMRPLSFHCTGGTICWRGGWSCLPARSSAAASCTLAPLSEGGRQGEESVKGEDEWCGGERERAVRAQVYLPQPIKLASLGDSAKSTAGPCVMSEPQQPVTAAEGGRHYRAD